MIVLLVMTDGRRHCVERAIPTALEMLEGPITRHVIFDDSDDLAYRLWLSDTFPAFDVMFHPMGRQGFGGAIRTAWRHIGLGPEEYVFHLEDDFVLNRPVDLASMATVLEENPHLVQLALRRQPWNEEERRAGGIVEAHPDDFFETTNDRGDVWLEHRRFMTTNPSLYRRSLTWQQRWPTGPNSEGRFTHQLLADPAVRFGFWGSRESGEWVEHIGTERVGVGY